ncbi:MAG: glycerol-3-phosphate dehydrogenase subunit GlpB, partial [Rhodobiaceae bacterium]|nr:glycerol-3-phosphate dehydrogenase subunit GlpB [Rhodobiaceae bacterium]
RDRGFSVAQFGHTGAISYTTGYFDLLGALERRVLDDPWSGLAELRRAEPDHPLARLPVPDIRAAFERFTECLCEMGIDYTAPGDRNLRGLLPYGVTKPTLSIPQTMRPGIEALRENAPTLLVDFEGLQGFSATEFRLNMADRWPALQSARLTFPGIDVRPVFPEVMARSLETTEAQEKLAELIRPLLNGARYVGLPAILGIHAPDATRASMERLVGATIFEIPTIPPAVAGIRLRELFERELPRRGVRLEPQIKVSKASFGDTGARLLLHGAMDDLEVEASAVILATGRFLSGGLRADRHRVRETLLDMPVFQPDDRDAWFSADYLDPKGHALNRAGVETDVAFRPLGPDGHPVSDRLFAAGAVLAHQDWVRQRCGSGLAIASAYGAIAAAAEVLGKS